MKHGHPASHGDKVFYAELPDVEARRISMGDRQVIDRMLADMDAVSRNGGVVVLAAGSLGKLTTDAGVAERLDRQVALKAPAAESR
jgi:AAA+ superfamily predicted ATPase